MEKKEYNKLVRDLIPEYLKSIGIKSKTKTVSGQQKLGLLFEKLHEEFSEFKNAKNNVERQTELCDMYEVIRGIATHYGYEWNTIENLAKSKRQEKGVFLIETEKEN